MIMETSMTLTEIKQLEETEPQEFWIYYYYLKALKMKEARQMEEMRHDTKSKGKHKTVSFPKDFVSEMQKKVVNLED